ncbi:hypothetical protein FA95DRAFT_1019067 [Auriscalpium vulgare]|uniref:Uncharacterized protein n=1 Tax=Auriscalpium vulgare TaxID=40419 RepID=A0ACB8R6V2_9AGAM|nr:hypothetical protein FA95DRAFT_1019067 [Auriscalpium vulgare]
MLSADLAVRIEIFLGDTALHQAAIGTMPCTDSVECAELIMCLILLTFLEVQTRHRRHLYISNPGLNLNGHCQCQLLPQILRAVLRALAHTGNSTRQASSMLCFSSPIGRACFRMGAQGCDDAGNLACAGRGRNVLVGLYSFKDSAAWLPVQGGYYQRSESMRTPPNVQRD